MIWKWLLHQLAKINFKIYLLFLALTTVLWLLMKLSDSYNHTLQLHLDFDHTPKGYALVDVSDSVLQVFVSAEGYKILRFSGNSKEKISVPLDEISFAKQANGALLGKINTSLLRPMINSQLGVSISERNIQPQVIEVQLDRLDTIHVPVIYQQNIPTKAGYRTYGDVQLFPASIQVVGPRFILDTLSRINLEALDLPELDKDYEKTIPLKSPHKGLECSPNQLRFKVHIAKYVDAEMEVPIKVNSQVSGIQIKTFPTEIKLSFQVAMPDYEKLHDSLFTVEVEIDSLAALRKTSLIPRLTRCPKFVENVQMDTEKVDFILIRNND